MKSNAFSIIALLFIICLLGCSSKTKEPVANLFDYNAGEIPESENSINTSNNLIINSGSVEFNLETLTAKTTHNRTTDQYLKVTHIFPPPHIVINHYDPLTCLIDVDVTLVNPFHHSGYDVRLIIFTDDMGHLLVNPDNWTNLFDKPGGFYINPFKAYAKTEPDRFFAGYSEHTENLSILLPGGNSAVDYAIIACRNENCEDPYEVGNFQQSALFEFTSNNAGATVDIYDWQDDVDSVLLYCNNVIGSAPVSAWMKEPNLWEFAFENKTGALPGDYPGFIAVTSFWSREITTYLEISITVTESSTPIEYETEVYPYTPENVLGFDIHGNHLYQCYGDREDRSLCITDISDPYSQPLVGTLHKSGAIAVDVEGNIACVVFEDDEMIVLDISDPSLPVEVGSIEMEYGCNVEISGNYAYLVASHAGLRKIDIEDPANPFLDGYVIGLGTAYDLKISGDYACVGTDTGLKIVDLDYDAPLSPQIIGTFDTLNDIKSIDAYGMYAYIGDGKKLRIIDFSYPAYPVDIASIDIVDNQYQPIWRIDAQGDFVYVTNFREGFRIVDVTTKLSPVLYGAPFVPISGGIEEPELKVNGRFAFISGSAWEGHFWIIELWPEE